jgi:hypothetical protein
MFHPNRRTDIHTGMTNLIVAFRHFANAPKIGKISWAISERHLVEISTGQEIRTVKYSYHWAFTNDTRDWLTSFVNKYRVHLLSPHLARQFDRTDSFHLPGDHRAATVLTEGPVRHQLQGVFTKKGQVITCVNVTCPVLCSDRRDSRKTEYRIAQCGPV